MKIIIDRIVNGMVVAELPNGHLLDIPAILFPGAAEGDVFTIEKDVTETDARRKRIKEKVNKLFVD